MPEDIFAQHAHFTRNLPPILPFHGARLSHPSFPSSSLFPSLYVPVPNARMGGGEGVHGLAHECVGSQRAKQINLLEMEENWDLCPRTSPGKTRNSCPSPPRDNTLRSEHNKLHALTQH
jgi:hypothetical protein